ncbi:OLC1v1005986C1 [Oldenlandia corymbosa var. corymbosa]|uniref:OLC1v1005986C1 n=1 Tax=Oldenlandia corymbosa var. corymbosa TaxID=529605 RepID=A0AAV1DJB0_OLDCO|nr:OLC1v1005986C1 [Oldenlandia corymbosa var. corymbosa]
MCPGFYNSFFGSMFQAFSADIIEAAFNTKKDRIQRILNKQDVGVFVKASEEQIKALSHPEENGVWPLWEGLKGAVNIFKRWPLQENEYGKLYRVDLVEYRRLQDLEIAISFMNYFTRRNVYSNVQFQGHKDFTESENLETVCFEIKADGNEEVVLVGKKNVIHHLEKEAKELAFGYRSMEELEEIFDSQNDEYFVKGPRSFEPEARADA